MPMRKRRYRKRPAYRRKRNTLKKKVNRIYNSIEQKHQEHSLGGNIDNVGLFFTLCSPGQGNGAQSRIGMKCNITSIMYSANGVFDGNAFNYNEIRIIVFYDRQSDGIIPAQADLLQNPAAPWNSMINFNNRHRFKVISDKKMFVDVNTPNAGLKFYKRMNVPVQFILTTSGASAVSRNSLFMYVVTDSSAIPHPAMNIQARVTYTDI